MFLSFIIVSSAFGPINRGRIFSGLPSNAPLLKYTAWLGVTPTASQSFYTSLRLTTTHLELSHLLLRNSLRRHVALAIVPRGPSVREVERHRLAVLALNGSKLQLVVTTNLHHIEALIGELLLQFGSNLSGRLFCFRYRACGEESSGYNEHGTVAFSLERAMIKGETEKAPSW